MQQRKTSTAAAAAAAAEVAAAPSLVKAKMLLLEMSWLNHLPRTR